MRKFIKKNNVILIYELFNHIFPFENKVYRCFINKFKSEIKLVKNITNII